jgi:hypothetical protein
MKTFQACVLLILLASCDRTSLQDGPRLSTEAPPPEPPPECSPPPAADLRGKIFINEVMVLNESTLEENGAFPPWIEIYNATDEEIDLGLMALSDDLAVPDKWTFPCNARSILPPKGFIVVFADGDTADPDDLHASFTLSVAPLNLILNKGSNLFLFFDTTALTPDRSVGRLPDGASSIVALGPPTPGAANAAAPLLPSEGEFVRGDANDDGRINIRDMHHVLAVLFRGEPLPPCPDRLDADDSGAIDLTDVQYIGAALFRSGPVFPSPFPNPGADPTADAIPCSAE